MAALEQMPPIGEVVYGQRWITEFLPMVRLLKRVALVVGILFGMAALFVSANTVRLAFFSRQDEIEIMRLVGATETFVKMPFYLESAFLGLLGAGGGVGSLYSLFVWFPQPYSAGYFPAPSPGCSFLFLVCGGRDHARECPVRMVGMLCGVTAEMNRPCMLRALMLGMLFFAGQVMAIWLDTPVMAAVDHKRSLKSETRQLHAMDRQRFEARIQQLQKDAQQLDKSRLAVIDTLDAIDQQISQQQLRVSVALREADALTEKITRSREHRQQLLKGVEENQERVMARLVALHRMERMGSWHLFSKPGSLFRFWKRQQDLKMIIRSDMALLDRQACRVRELERVTELLQGERCEKKLLDGRLALEIEKLAAEKKRRQALLESVTEKKELLRAAMVSARRALEKTMQRLSATGGEQAPKARKGPAVSVMVQGTGRFLSRKGVLPMPVAGEIVSYFGSSGKKESRISAYQSGIDIKVERGEPVRSVFQGEILYADWLRGYGNVVIINHGDHYYTLYAHVQELFKKKGDKVTHQEVIATAGDAGPSRGSCLHFEVRHHGKPMDPLKWLKKGV